MGTKSVSLGPHIFFNGGMKKVLFFNSCQFLSVHSDEELRTFAYCSFGQLREYGQKIILKDNIKEIFL